MFIKTSNAALGAFCFLVLTAIFIILHNLVSSLTNADDHFFFGLVFLSFLAFIIFTVIVIVKLFPKFVKKSPPDFISDVPSEETKPPVV